MDHLIASRNKRENGLSASHLRSYDRSSSVVFRRTKEKWGGLSNMAAGYPIELSGIRILTSEALYQCCRFPHFVAAQEMILAQRSPMTAKMKSKLYRGDTRPNWEYLRVIVMRWCLEVKLAQNWDKFSRLLLETGDRPIVEDSKKDNFWGAEPADCETLIGYNVLGRLLMELREKVREAPQAFETIEPPDIDKFWLLGKPIGNISRHNSTARKENHSAGPIAKEPKSSNSEPSNFELFPSSQIGNL